MKKIIDNRYLISLPKTKLSGLAAKLICGFLLSTIQIFGGAMSFGIAAGSTWGLLSSLGACVGYLLLFPTEAAAPFIFAAVISFVAQLFVSKNSRRIKAAISSAALFIAFAFLGDMNNAIIQSVICFSACFVLEHVKTDGKRGVAFKGIFAALLLLSLCGMSIGSMNVGIMLAVVVLLVLAGHGKAAAATISAIFAAGVLILHNSELTMLAAPIIIATFFACVFGKGKKTAIISFFGISLTLTMILLGFDYTNIFFLLNISAGIILYSLIPTTAFERIAQQFFAVKGGDLSSQIEIDNISDRLKFTLGAFDEIKDGIKGKKSGFNNITDVFQVSAEKVCKKCDKFSKCWVENYSFLMDGFNDITLHMKAGEAFESSGFLKDNCGNIAALEEVIKENYEVFRFKEQRANELSEVRDVSLSQIDAISSLLDTLSSEIKQISEVDERNTVILKKLLSKHGVPHDGAYVYKNIHGEAFVEIYLEKSLEVKQKNMLRQGISRATGIYFDTPSIMTVGDRIRLALFERPAFKTDFGFAQASAHKANYCGDNMNYFTDGRGNAHMLLSDGMGKGKAAFSDSEMTVSMMSKLLNAGFGFPAAAKLVNSSFIVKSVDESLSTIDVFTLDLYTGTAKFFKAGAPDSFILSRGGEVKRITSESLPIGILSGIRYSEQSVKLLPGDRVVLMSDGVYGFEENGEKWIEPLLAKARGLSPREIAEVVKYKAEKTAYHGQIDDITVLVLEVSGNAKSSARVTSFGAQKKSA